MEGGDHIRLGMVSSQLSHDRWYYTNTRPMADSYTICEAIDGRNITNTVLDNCSPPLFVHLSKDDKLNLAST